MVTKAPAKKLKKAGGKISLTLKPSLTRVKSALAKNGRLGGKKAAASRLTKKKG